MQASHVFRSSTKAPALHTTKHVIPSVTLQHKVRSISCPVLQRGCAVLTCTQSKGVADHICLPGLHIAACKRSHRLQHRRCVQAAITNVQGLLDSEAASTSGRCDPESAGSIAGSSRQLQPSRRQLLLGNALLIASTAVASQQPAYAAAEGSCQLQDSATGLQWCDLQVGDGQLPIKSAFTK